MSEVSELKYLYQSNIAYAMYDKLGGCAFDWETTGFDQYRVEVEKDGVTWVLNLGKGKYGNVMLDFQKNGSFFYSLSSDDQPILNDLFSELKGSEELEKDRELMGKIGTEEGCR